MRIINLVFLILVVREGNAQDLHFSHFYHSPLYLNPAHTGAFDGNLRLGCNYRNQWQSITIPYRSFSGWGDYHIWEGGAWIASAGLVILHDQAGDGDLTVKKFFASASITWILTIDFSVTLGLGGGWVQKNLDFSQLTFDDQWTNTGFNTALPTNELMGEQFLGLPDVSAGLRLNYTPNSDFQWFLSIAMAHVNLPTESFYNNGHKLGMRPVIQAGGNWQLNDHWRVESAGLWMLQKKAQEFLLGTNVGYTLDLSTPIILYGGGWFRGSGDGIPAVGLQYKNVKGIISYDINVSSLIEVSRYRGGMELSLVYILKLDRPDARIVVPCIRF